MNTNIYIVYHWQAYIYMNTYIYINTYIYMNTYMYTVYHWQADHDRHD